MSSKHGKSRRFPVSQSEIPDEVREGKDRSILPEGNMRAYAPQTVGGARKKTGGRKKADVPKSVRLTKYDTHVLPRLEEIEGMSREGVPEEQIAGALGIAYSTFNEYKKRPELSEALKRSREAADYAVENALFKRCVGHKVKIKKHYKVKTVEYDQDTGRKTAEREELQEVEEEQYVPPDTAAQIFWLTNRKGDRWKNKQAIDQAGGLEISLKMEGTEGLDE